MDKHPTAPALNPVRPPNADELKQLWAWLVREGHAENCLLEEANWFQTFWIAVFDTYCTGSPGYSGKLLYLVWDGAPHFCEVFTSTRDGTLVHERSHGDGCTDCSGQDTLLPILPLRVIVNAAPTEHTGGDWFPHYHEGSRTWSVHARNGSFDHELAQVLWGGREAEANARLMAAAPELLKLARTFKATCEDRLSLLKEDEKEWRPDDEREDMIGHFTALLDRCERVLGDASAA